VRLTAVVARARNGVIGAQGRVPWRLKTDLRHFRTVTMGKPVLMGRKTWDSLPGALPGRDNIVLSRNVALRPAGAWLHATPAAALACATARAKARGVDEICVIGGAEIFRDLYSLLTHVQITEVDCTNPGDVSFAGFDSGWREISSRHVPAGPDDEHAMTFRLLGRVNPAP
jgi:dihydrofolate reductase